MSTRLHPNPAPAPQVPGSPAGLPARLTVARVRTGLLEHLERSKVTLDAGQYQLVARRLAGELAALQPDAMMDAWLRGHTVASEMYENLSYEHAGLCRQPLDAALAAEMATRELIERARA